MKPAELIKRWFEQIWNDRDLTGLDRYRTQDAVSVGLDASKVQRPEYAAFFARALEVMEDTRVEVDCIEQGPMVASHVVVHFTFMGKKSQLRGMCFSRIEGGLAAEAWNVFDTATMLRGLGIDAPDGVSSGEAVALLAQKKAKTSG